MPVWRRRTLEQAALRLRHVSPASRYLAIAGIGKSGTSKNGAANSQEVCIYDRRMLSAAGGWRPVSATRCVAWDQAVNPQTLSTMKMQGFSRLEFSPDGRLLLATPWLSPRSLLPGMQDGHRRRGPLLAPHYVLRCNHSGIHGGGDAATEQGVVTTSHRT